MLVNISEFAIVSVILIGHLRTRCLQRLQHLFNSLIPTVNRVAINASRWFNLHLIMILLNLNFIQSPILMNPCVTIIYFQKIALAWMLYREKMWLVLVEF